MGNATVDTGPPTTLDKVTAAVTELGEATAAAIAAHAGIGYSTATKRLRALENAGLAQPFRVEDGRTLWKAADSNTGNGSEQRPDEPPTQEQATASDTVTTPQVQPADDGTRSESAEHDSASQPDRAGDDPDPQTRPTAGHAPAVEASTDRPALPQNNPAAAGPHDPDLHDQAVRHQRHPPADTKPDKPASDDNPPADLERPATSADGEPQSSPAPSDQGATTKTRRPGGSLRGAILDVLEANPDRQYKTSELCKAIDNANQGSSAAKASAGAVVNAVHKLVTAGAAIQTVERPATFQLAPKTA